MSRCTGHCCKAFFLPFSPQEMRTRLDEDRAREKNEGWPENSSGLFDGEQIYAMITHLGEFTTREAVEKFGTGIITDTEDADKTRGHYYTCKNLQENGDCGIYETRPRMCRDYPYGKPCRYQACTAAHRGEHFEQSKKTLPMFMDKVLANEG